MVGEVALVTEWKSAFTTVPAKRWFLDIKLLFNLTLLELIYRVLESELIHPVKSIFCVPFPTISEFSSGILSVKIIEK